MHAFETSELRGEVEAQVRAAAEAQDAMEGKHHAALVALKAEHAKEKVRRDDMQRRLGPFHRQQRLRVRRGTENKTKLSLC